MTKHTPDDREFDAPPTPDDRPSMSSLAKKFDAAVRLADEKRAAVATAQETLTTASQELAEAVAAVSTLSAQIDALVKDVLSLGGTAHVAS